MDFTTCEKGKKIIIIEAGFKFRFDKKFCRIMDNVGSVILIRVIVFFFFKIIVHFRRNREM